MTNVQKPGFWVSLGRFFDRRIRRLEDRHRGELAYVRGSLQDIQPLAKADEASALKVISVALEATHACGKEKDLKPLATQMASLTENFLTQTGTRPPSTEKPSQPAATEGPTDERFEALIASLHEIAARDQNETKDNQRGQAQGEDQKRLKAEHCG